MYIYVVFWRNKPLLLENIILYFASKTWERNFQVSEFFLKTERSFMSPFNKNKDQILLLRKTIVRLIFLQENMCFWTKLFI
jgi:hypothetical protein